MTRKKPPSSSRGARIAVLAIVAAATLGWSTACTDPVLDQRIADQGNEIDGIDKGEFHRAGSRCVACHQESGEASGSPFSLAGTVFAQPLRDVGVGDVAILLTDADGTKYTAKTNCVGNFFVKPSEWAPKFPVLVAIEKNGVRRSMRSPVGRDADCAGCHKLEVTDPLVEVDQVYLYNADEPNRPDGDPACPVDPVRAGTK